MGRLIPLLFLVEVALVAVALISCLSAEEDDIRALPRFPWVFIILFFPLVGPVAWLVAGRPVVPVTGQADRPRRSGGPGGTPTGRQPRPRRRPLAPDDDPEFLRSLDSEQARRDRELFRQWEADLGRRDDEPPGKETGRGEETDRGEETGRETGGAGQEDSPPRP